MDKSCSVKHYDEIINVKNYVHSNVLYDNHNCVLSYNANYDETKLEFTEILICTGAVDIHCFNEENCGNLKLVSLTDNDLREYPTFLTHLKYLTSLELSHNKISNLPEDMDLLKNLTILNFSHNSVSTIPLSLFSLTRLQSLNCSSNCISELPPSIGNLKGLQIFDCSSNNIVRLPEQLTSLVNLTILRLMNNKLGHLPESFADLSNLLILQLDGNVFDHIPAQMFLCSSLVELSMSKNYIVGSLSDRIKDLFNLRTVNLSYNQFSYFSMELFQLNHLEYININGNRTKQVEFGSDQLNNLQEISFAGCSLLAPPRFSHPFPALRFLDLNNNRITCFDANLNDFPRLNALFLAHNQLSTLPTWICHLNFIISLELQNNYLRTLPAEFSKLRFTLRQLNLASNYFTTLPKCLFEKDSRLIYLCLDNNPVVRLPDELSNLRELTHLSLCNCPDLQELPSELGDCVNLRMLRFSHCALKSLPNSLVKLNSLKYLEISHNQFVRFPAIVCFLPRLKVLLYDQEKGNPLVTSDYPKNWYALSELLYPTNLMEEPAVGPVTPSLPPDSSSYGDIFRYYEKLNMALPPLIGALSQLTHLSLQGNGLFILPDVFHLMNLNRLNLSNNRLHFLPPQFHESKRLTHLYLHDNMIKRLSDNFRHMTSLVVLTLNDNPFICPPVDICSGRKVPPVHLYLEQQKKFESAVLYEMCKKVIRSLPLEAETAFLSKVGFPRDIIQHLDDEYPGGYNRAKRLRIALEAWTEIEINLPQLSRGSSTSMTESSHESSMEGNSDKGSSVDETGSETTLRTHQSDRQSTRSETEATSQSSNRNVLSIMKSTITGPEADPYRLLHIANILCLNTLYDELAFVLHKAQQPKF